MEEFIFKLVLLGESAVGKTSLIQRFVHNTFQHDLNLTIGVNLMTKVVMIDNSPVTLSIIDLAGQERFRKFQNIFYLGANAAIYVFDYTRPYTLEKLNRWQNDLFTGVHNEREIVQILIGNKVDLKKHLLVDEKEIQRRAFELGCDRFIRTSALTGKHVDEAFTYIAAKLLENIKLKEKESEKMLLAESQHLIPEHKLH
ncbi:MAG: GTP-binding protein [Candidatus Hodarchaeota archaeon]